jgi:magnesium chelatase family protein
MKWLPLPDHPIIQRCRVPGGLWFYLIRKTGRFPYFDFSIFDEKFNKPKDTPYKLMYEALKDIGDRDAIIVGGYNPDDTMMAPKNWQRLLADWPADLSLIACPEVAQAAAARGIRAFSAVTQGEALAIYADVENRTPLEVVVRQETPKVDLDFSMIAGCEQAKRVVEIAAAGGHDVMLIGPPGVGKSLLGKAVGGILPPIEQDEANELLGATGEVIGCRPVALAEPNTTINALVGGGSQEPVPGLVTKAHGGVLVAEELLRWGPATMNALLVAMQEGKTVVSRTKWQQTYPARFQLFATANPVAADLAKMSEALKDRIELYCEVGAAKPEEYLAMKPQGETSEQIRARVLVAYEMQRARGMRNARLGPESLGKLNLSPAAYDWAIETARSRGWVGARPLHHLVFVARTIADLAGSEEIRIEHVQEAEQFGGLRKFDTGQA